VHKLSSEPANCEMTAVMTPQELIVQLWSKDCIYSTGSDKLIKQWRHR